MISLLFINKKNALKLRALINMRGTTLVLAMLALILPITGRTGHLFRGQLQGSNVMSIAAFTFLRR